MALQKLGPALKLDTKSLELLTEQTETIDDDDDEMRSIESDSEMETNEATIRNIKSFVESEKNRTILEPPTDHKKKTIENHQNGGQ